MAHASRLVTWRTQGQFSLAKKHEPWATSLDERAMHEPRTINNRVNPPAPLVGATRLRGILCNPVSSVPCILCTLFSVSRFPVSVSGSLETGLRDPGSGLRKPGIVFLSARGLTNLPSTRRVPRIWGDPRITLKTHQICKPVPRATKIMKIDPKVTKNHEKSDLES